MSSVSLRRPAAALLVLVFAGTASAEPKRQSSETAPAATVASLDIFNFGEISASYFRGGELDGQGASALAARGVKTVIDLRSDGDYSPTESQWVSDAGMKYVRIPMTTRKEPTADQIAKFLALATDPASQPVYVHCVEGRHRTGVMTAVYRMTVDGWTADRAFDEMKRYKFGMDFLHPEFKRFVYGYRPAAPAAPEAASETVVAAN